MNENLEMRTLWQAVERRLVLVVTIVVLSAVAGYAYVASADRTYEATSALLIASEPDVDSLDADRALAAQRLALTLSELVKRQPVLDPVAFDLSLDETWQQLRNRVAVTLIPETQVLRISATAGSPEAAEQLVAAITDSFIVYSEQVLPSQQVVIDPATATAAPVSPSAPITVLAATLGGVVLAFAVAQILEWRSTRFDRRVDGVEVIWVGSPRGLRPGRRRVSDTQASAEYRRSLIRLFGRTGDDPLRSLMITGDRGASTYEVVAARCAIALAEGGAHVVVVRLAGAHGKASSLLNPPLPGVHDFLADPLLRAESLMTLTATSGLELLPVGEPTRSTPVHRRVARLGELLDEVLENADVVILVGPLDDPLSGVEQLLARVQVVAVAGTNADQPEETVARLRAGRPEIDAVAVVVRPALAVASPQLADRLAVGRSALATEDREPEVLREVPVRSANRRWGSGRDGGADDTGDEGDDESPDGPEQDAAATAHDADDEDGADNGALVLELTVEPEDESASTDDHEPGQGRATS